MDNTDSILLQPAQVNQKLNKLEQKVDEQNVDIIEQKVKKETFWEKHHGTIKQV